MQLSNDSLHIYKYQKEYVYADKNKETKKEILYYAKLLDEKGLVNTLEGNLSILDRETGKNVYHTFWNKKAFS